MNYKILLMSGLMLSAHFGATVKAGFLDCLTCTQDYYLIKGTCYRFTEGELEALRGKLLSLYNHDKALLHRYLKHFLIGEEITSNDKKVVKKYGLIFGEDKANKRMESFLKIAIRIQDNKSESGTVELRSVGGMKKTRDLILDH